MPGITTRAAVGIGGLHAHARLPQLRVVQPLLPGQQRPGGHACRLEGLKPLTAGPDAERGRHPVPDPAPVVWPRSRSSWPPTRGSAMISASPSAPSAGCWNLAVGRPGTATRRQRTGSACSTARAARPGGRGHRGPGVDQERGRAGHQRAVRAADRDLLAEARALALDQGRHRARRRPQALLVQQVRVDPVDRPVGERGLPHRDAERRAEQFGRLAAARPRRVAGTEVLRHAEHDEPGAGRLGQQRGQRRGLTAWPVTSRVTQIQAPASRTRSAAASPGPLHVADCLPRLQVAQPGSDRRGSPPGGSIRTTLAPKSASSIVATARAIPAVRSTTRTPPSALMAGPGSCFIVSSIPAAHCARRPYPFGAASSARQLTASLEGINRT